MKFVMAMMMLLGGISAHARTAEEACKEHIRERVKVAWNDVLETVAGSISTVETVTQTGTDGDLVVYKATDFWNDNWIIGPFATVKVEMNDDGCRIKGIEIQGY